MGGKCYHIEEDDSVKEHKFYSMLTQSHHPTAILDCGAQVTMAREGSGPTAPTNTRICRVAGVLTGNVHTGRVDLHTRTNQGHPYRISFPDSLVHPSVGTILISYHSLLKLGYKPILDLNGGTVHAPNGSVISLIQKDGLWHFPSAISYKSTPVARSIKLHNSWAALHTVSCEETAPTKQPASANKSISVNTDRAQALHN